MQGVGYAPPGCGAVGPCVRRTSLLRVSQGQHPQTDGMVGGQAWIRFCPGRCNTDDRSYGPEVTRSEPELLRGNEWGRRRPVTCAAGPGQVRRAWAAGTLRAPAHFLDGSRIGGHRRPAGPEPRTFVSARWTIRSDSIRSVALITCPSGRGRPDAAAAPVDILNWRFAHSLFQLPFAAAQVLAIREPCDCLHRATWTVCIALGKQRSWSARDVGRPSRITTWPARGPVRAGFTHLPRPAPA